VGPLRRQRDAIVYTPIGNDSTRMAALLSGDIDFTMTRRRRI